MKDGEEDELLKNTIREERLQVFNIARRLGSKLSGLMITCGVLIFIFGIYLLFVPIDLSPTVSLGIIFTGALGFIGGLNILCGFLLLIGED